MNRTLPIQSGIREQHLLRKRNNPLFPAEQQVVSARALEEARVQDALEKERFMRDFHALVQKAIDLDANVASETLLEIKEELDKSYQQSCALPGDLAEVKQAIKKLIAVIMQSIWQNVGSDEFARQQLRDEEIARDTHFELQKIPLVAALTHPQSPIEQDELIPTLLSEPGADLESALQLFDEQQTATIYNDATRFMQQRDPKRTLSEAWQRLSLIEEHFRTSHSHSTPN